MNPLRSSAVQDVMKRGKVHTFETEVTPLSELCREAIA